MQFFHGTSLWQQLSMNKSLAFPSSHPTGYYDALIVGAGMSGSLCTWTFAQSGMRLLVLDQQAIGGGSTSANTGLLQYMNDEMLSDLIVQIGEQKAVRFYRLCFDAVRQIEQVTTSLSAPCDFIERKSLYYASSRMHQSKLERDYAALLAHGFPVRYLDAEQVKSGYGFSKHGAILTMGDAEINPLAFCRAIYQTLLERRKIDVLEQTSLLNLEEESDGVVVQTTAGTIRTGAVIFTTGYAKTPFLTMKKVTINRTFAVATAPIATLTAHWPEQALLWETRRPYLYLRTSSDGRIIAGGFDQSRSELPDQPLIESQAHRLKTEIQNLFPDLPITIEYAWGALFGESSDGLPFIGRHPEHRHLYYLLGYGGNGTVYSMLGSLILRDLLCKGTNEDASLFRLDR
ncbi:MAG: FAD-dependent oxidoreductase [Sporolactobacillus sp.]